MKHTPTDIRLHTKSKLLEVVFNDEHEPPLEATKAALEAEVTEKRA